MEVYNYNKGVIPLLISMPHAGSYIPEDIQKNMTKVGQASSDTDWYVERLYEFAKDMGVYWLQANYSRYVIDLNRGADDATLYPGRNTTGLCPVTTFTKEPIYQDNRQPDTSEITNRLEHYWQPYHEQLQGVMTEIKSQFGYVFVLEAHSIASVVPRFFDGQLTDFNFGSNNGQTCPEEILHRIKAIDFTPYSVVFDDVFKGGFITRNYANLEAQIYTLQLELSQAVYMNECDGAYSEVKASQCRPLLMQIINALKSN